MRTAVERQLRPGRPRFTHATVASLPRKPFIEVVGGDTTSEDEDEDEDGDEESGDVDGDGEGAGAGAAGSGAGSAGGAGPSLLQAESHYGFDERTSGAFRDLGEELLDIIECPAPDSMDWQARRGA